MEKNVKVVIILLCVALVPLFIYQTTRVFRPIPLSQLHGYVGKSRKVEMTVARIQPTYKGDVVLHARESGDFRLILPTSLLSKFPKNPELYYVGKTLRVTETIRQDEDGYFMTLESKQQIEEVK